MRLKDADELITILDEELNKDWSLSKALLVGFAKQILNDAPTVDAVPTDFHDKCQQIEIQKRLKLEEELKNAEPIRHGRWLTDGYDYRCSQCGLYVGGGDIPKTMKYCPNCGAKMDEVVE